MVDSGATSTFVWVVVDGSVDETRTQSVSVGGWHVSQFLKQAMAWKGELNKEAAGVRLEHFETSTTSNSLIFSRPRCPV